MNIAVGATSLAVAFTNDYAAPARPSALSDQRVHLHLRVENSSTAVSLATDHIKRFRWPPSPATLVRPNAPQRREFHGSACDAIPRQLSLVLAVVRILIFTLTLTFSPTSLTFSLTFSLT